MKNTTSHCLQCNSRLGWRNGSDVCINGCATVHHVDTTGKIKTWGRAGNGRPVRTCPICKTRFGWGDRFRTDTRTQTIWHVACETSPRFAKLLAWIAKQPTYTPTFPQTVQA